MNREQFYGQLATLDEQRLKKALWNLYWRGSAATRERIEAEIGPDQQNRGKRLAKEPADPQRLLDEVGDFVALARRVRIWPVTGACRHENARAGDSRFSVWSPMRRMASAPRTPVPQQPQWSSSSIWPARRVTTTTSAPESHYGWTRSGWGRVSEKEASLASVLAQMLPAPDMWAGFADRYLDALDQVARDDPARPNRAWRPTGRDRDRRTADLAEWHRLLLDRLIDSEAEDRLDRLARHPALGGPELGFLQARLAHRHGDVGSARSLVQAALQQLPGHQGFLDFATEIGAPLPPRAQQIIKERSR